MREVRGKQIPDSIGELISPARTALVVVDVQNDFCSPKGLVARQRGNLQMINGAIQPLKRLVEGARGAGVMVVFAMNTTQPACRSDSPAMLYFKAIKGAGAGERDPGCTIEGSWGHRVISEIEVRPTDVVVQKTRSSAFVPTNLGSLLRSNGIQTVVIGGVLTSDSIVTTASDALSCDFCVVVANDCIADYDEGLHQAAYKVMDSRYTVIPSEALLREWAQGRKA